MLFFIAVTSLFDSISTFQQIVIFILLLATLKPIRNSFCFLAGLAIVYFLCGILGYLSIGKLNALIQGFFPSLASVPDAVYYKAQMILGFLLFFSGPAYYFYKKYSRKPRLENRLIHVLKRINPTLAFGLGAFLSITGFPFSIPYIGAIEKIALSGMGRPTGFFYIFLYNLGYVLPMIAVFLIYLFFRKNESEIEHKLHIHADIWNRILTILFLCGMGILLILDSALFYLNGHALLKTRFF